MRWLRFSIFILIVTLIQAGNLLDWIAVTSLNIRPDLLLLCLVFFALSCNNYDALISSFAIGLAADLAGSAMGSNIISYGIIGCLICYLRNLIILRKTTHQIIVVFIICFLTGVVSHWLSLVKSSAALPGAYAALFGTSIYTALVAPYLNSVLHKISGWMGVRKYHFSPAGYR